MRSTIGFLLASMLLVLGACGGGDGDGDVTADRGWLDGEPEWSTAADEADGESAVDLSTDDADTAAGTGGDDGARSESTSDPIGDEPGAAPQGPLRAGSIDDNDDFAAYLDYMNRLDDLGVAVRDLDATGRITVTVTDPEGRPVAGTPVLVSNGEEEVATVRTTADGTTRFHPGFYGAPTADVTYTFDVAGASATAAPGGQAAITVDGPGGAEAPVPLDVLFLLDATGSMGDEIDRLKTQIDSVSESVAALDGSPDVRFAMTLYRDEGDAFVTATRDFTGDVDAFRADLAEVVADGGGDYPEALDEGLADALAEPSWRDPSEAVQLIFLVADAPPQVGRQVDVGYDESLRNAIDRGIKIFPVASSNSDDQAEAVFRQLAQGSGSRFVFLSYGAGGAATGDNTDIDATDYEELALDDLVVRLIGEELSSLTGDDQVVPPTTSTSTTVPPDQ